MLAEICWSKYNEYIIFTVPCTLQAIQIKYPYLNINCLYFHFTSSSNHTFELPCAINYNRQGISLLTAVSQGTSLLTAVSQGTSLLTAVSQGISLLTAVSQGISLLLLLPDSSLTWLMAVGGNRICCRLLNLNTLSATVHVRLSRCRHHCNQRQKSADVAKICDAIQGRNIRAAARGANLKRRSDVTGIIENKVLVNSEFYRQYLLAPSKILASLFVGRKCVKIVGLRGRRIITLLGAPLCLWQVLMP
jgi:hypothetical protein